MVHRVPTSADFLEAVRLGLGWGVVPEPQLRPALADGRLVAAGRPAGTSTYRCTGSAGGSTHPPWTGSPTSSRRSARAHLRR